MSTEEHMNQRQISELLGVSLGTVNNDLQNIPDTYKKESDLTKLSDKCKGLPWFCGPEHVVGECNRCFWGVITEPVNKNNQPQVCFDYELELISAIEQYEKVALVKSRSIGATQCLLIYILYRILSLQEPGNYFIVSGNDWEQSRGMMRRLRAILSRHNIFTDDKETVLSFPNIDARIQCYSSKVNSLRSWDRVKFCMVDELDSLENSQDIRAVVEAYVVKSGAKLVLLTTPGKINSTMHRISKEPEPCFYYRMSIPYERSLGKLLDEKTIAVLKESSPSFDSEFSCKFGAVKQGNVWTEKSIQDALSIPYDIEATTANTNSPKSLGIDYGATGNTGMGGGFGAVCTAFEDGIVKVLDAKLWVSAEYNEILEDIRTMIQTYDPVKIYCDGSAVAFIRSLKTTPEISEDPEYQNAIKLYREMKVDWSNNMRVIPISWMKDQASMLGNCKMLFDQNSIAVSPSLDKLVIALRSCVAENMRVVKDLSQFNDLIDGLILATNEYKMGARNW
jgi:hypothetical protein